MNSANSRTSADLDLAPTTCLTTSPPENRMIVGTANTPYATMVSGFSSVFSLTTSTLPAYSLAIASSTGPTMRHGPHHGAQNSTITGTGLARTAAKLWSVTDFSSVSTVISLPGQLAVSSSGRCSATQSSRLPCAQTCASLRSRQASALSSAICVVTAASFASAATVISSADIKPCDPAVSPSADSA